VYRTSATLQAPNPKHAVDAHTKIGITCIYIHREIDTYMCAYASIPLAHTHTHTHTHTKLEGVCPALSALLSPLRHLHDLVLQLQVRFVSFSFFLLFSFFSFFCLLSLFSVYMHLFGHTSATRLAPSPNTRSTRIPRCSAYVYICIERWPYIYIYMYVCIFTYIYVYIYLCVCGMHTLRASTRSTRIPGCSAYVYISGQP